MLPPETAEDALELIREMEAYYRKSMVAFEEDDRYYEGDLEDVVEVPNGFDITIPTTGRAIIDEAVDNVEPYDMFIRYAPRKFGKAAQEEAESVQRFIKNTWTYWRQTNSDIDILRDFIKNLFKNGKGIFKIVPDWSLWPTLDAEEEALLKENGKLKDRVELIKQLRTENFPIMCRSISPRHIMEDPTMDARKLWCIEKYDTSIDEVRNRFAKHEEILRDPNPYNFIIKELWTATWVDWNGRIHLGKHWIFCNETLLEEEENPYHEIPYVIKHSGFGYESYDGTPEKKAVGFFTTQVKSMIRAEVRRLTHIDAMMSQFSFPIMLLPDSADDIDFDTDPGAINYVPETVLENAQSIFLQTKLPAPEYMQSISMIQSQIERGTTQRAVRGAGVPGTDSAAQLAMITSQAKLRLEPVKKGTEDAVDAVNALLLRFAAEIIDEDLSIFCAEPAGPDKYVLKPDYVRGRYRTRTTFQPNEDQIKERKLVLATDAMSKARLNPYDALTFAGWENPMEVIGRNLAYAIMEEPAIKRKLAKQYLEEWGLDAIELELEEINDSSLVQQMVMQLQQNMQGQGQQPGAQLAGQPQPQMQQQQPAAPSPQVAGAPLDQVNPMPSVNDARRDIGRLGG